MTANELLENLLKLFRDNIPDASFSQAYPGGKGSRAPTKPAVTGEVDGETVKPGSQELRFRFRIFLPAGAGADKMEDLFASMCSLAGQAYPGFSAISRGPVSRDSVTGLLTVSCSFSFLSQSESGDGAAQGTKVVLGGREYRASGIKTTIGKTGEELISIGETVPFAVRGERTDYTVELEGIDTSGLDRLAAFTVELSGSPGTVYKNCRWKSLSDVLRKAVFVSGEREEGR